jgi:hypothetical protein
MNLSPREFIRFLDGRTTTNAVVGFVPMDLSILIGCIDTDINITKEYAIKLIFKHGWKYEHFTDIQATINFGYCLQEGESHLHFIYIKDKSRLKKIDRLLIKVDKNKKRLWLVTFHPIQPAQLKKYREKYTLIRNHAEDEFLE